MKKKKINVCVLLGTKDEYELKRICKVYKLRRTQVLSYAFYFASYCLYNCPEFTFEQFIDYVRRH